MLFLFILILLFLGVGCLCYYNYFHQNEIIYEDINIPYEPIQSTIAFIAQPGIVNVELSILDIMKSVATSTTPIYVMYKDKIEIILGGKTEEIEFNNNVNDFYDLIYESGSKILLGFYTSSGLKTAIQWVENKGFENEISLISIGSTSSRLSQYKFVCRLASDQSYWVTPGITLRKRIEESQGTLVLYDEGDEANEDMANLMKDIKAGVIIEPITSDIKQQIQKYNVSQVVLLTFNISYLDRDDLPVKEYLTTDILLDSDLGKFSHKLIGFSPYFIYPSEFTKLTWSRIVYTTNILTGLSAARNLESLKIPVINANDEFRLRYDLNEFNDKNPATYIEWVWQKGVWSFGLGEENDVAITWAQKIAGKIESEGIGITNSTAAVRLCFLFRWWYWKNKNMDVRVTRQTLSVLPVPKNSDELFDLVLQNLIYDDPDSKKSVFHPSRAPKIRCAQNTKS